MEPASVAFLGLGVMGYPMAGHLHRAGHRVRVYNRTVAKAEKFAAAHPGAEWFSTPGEAAIGAEFVFACVGNDDDLRAVTIGASGAFAAAATVLGCSDPYEGRQAVYGKVTLEGQPLNNATILFEPVDNLPTTSGSDIVNGEYKIERKSGLKPGKYVVRITAGDGVTPAGEEEAGNPGGSTNILSKDRVPPDWNVNSKQEVTIKADGSNTFDFAIPKAVDTKAKTKKKR